jgi:puromycin-sensitive aminopeptidase
VTSPNSSGPEQRLPRSVAPLRYELHFTPDLEAATFTGTARISIDVRERVDSIVCNAAELDIDVATLSAAGGDDVPLSVTLDEEAQTVSFTPPAERAEIEIGEHVLAVSFRGVLNDQLRGFYRSTFTDADGLERVIATTQFESTDARRAFPCWDEPDRKAVFSITLDVPAGMLAVSNWPEVGSEDLGGGARRARFGDTIPMSTYLVCFVVGPLEATDPIDVNGTAVRVVHRPGRAHQTGFALEAAAHALPFFVDWFALPYPCPKLDMLAIPDFAAGAMENLGAVTFRESDLLLETAAASQAEMERVGSTVDHEIAHMWFGDLVTMRWWNGIWLNEAFATFMALLCLDDFRPAWRVWDSFARDRSVALGIDALHSTRPVEFPVRTPEEAEAMFDVLTYDKGGAVLRMLERFVGPARFREGVRAYLSAHVEGNTETTDLWDAIEEAAADEPVRSLMDSWIFQGGFPLVQVDATGDGVRLEAEPFARLREGDRAPAPGTPQSGIGRDWLVPVIVGRRGDDTAVREGTAPEDAPHTARIVLGATETTVDLGGDPAAAVVANVGGYGFYRVRYDEELSARLIAALDRLTPIERYCLVSDTWVCAHSGVASLDAFFALVDQLGDETDASVWSIVAGAVDTLDRAVAGADRPALEQWTRTVLGPQLQRVGWDAVPGEDPLHETLRASLIRRLGIVAGDHEVREECGRRFEADRSGAQPLSAGIAGAVMSVVARWGGDKELDLLVEGLRGAQTPQDERRHLRALSEVAQPGLAARVQEMCLGEIRSQDAPYLLLLMLYNRLAQASTWQFVETHWAEIVEHYPRQSLVDLLNGIVAFDAVDDEGYAPLAQSARAFTAEHPLTGREKLVDQHLEVMEVNLAFVHRERGRLGELLGA